MKTKVNAFTLMEVVIAMILAAISIAISFSVYSLISQSYRQYDLKNKKTAEFIQLSQLLQKDIQKAQYITGIQNELNIVNDAGEIDYLFEGAYLLRNHYGLKTDTFFIRQRELQLFFENNLLETEGIADEIRLEVEFNGDFIPLIYKKAFSSEELLNLTLPKP